MSRLVDGVGAVCRGFRPVCERPRAPLRCERSAAIGSTCRRPDGASAARAQLARDPRAGAGIAEALGADRHERRARVEQIARVRGALHAAHADRPGSAPRAATAATWASATARIAGPGQPAGAAAQPRPRARCARPARRERHRAQRVDQRHRVGAARPAAACAQAATSAVFGVSFTISGLCVCAAHGAHDLLAAARGSAPMSRPVLTFGQDTFSSIAAISARALARLARAARTPRRSSPSRS